MDDYNYKSKLTKHRRHYSPQKSKESKQSIRKLYYGHFTDYRNHFVKEGERLSQINKEDNLNYRKIEYSGNGNRLMTYG